MAMGSCKQVKIKQSLLFFKTNVTKRYLIKYIHEVYPGAVVLHTAWVNVYHLEFLSSKGITFVDPKIVYAFELMKTFIQRQLNISFSQLNP